MFGTSKLALVVAVATIGIASPALAQSVDHTGTLAASYYDGNGKQTFGSWVPQGATPRVAAPRVAANHNEHAVQGRGLYASTVTPNAAPIAPAVSGFDPSIASQR